MYKKIALAIAFSPRLESLLFEAARIRNNFRSELILIHIGERIEELEHKLLTLIGEAGIDQSNYKIVWEKGDPSKSILSVCKKEKVDLLITGALQKESFLTYYLGSIARKIIRKAECSVLTLINPSKEATCFKSIVVNGNENPKVLETISTACKWGRAEETRQIHILKEIKLYGLSLVVAGEGTEDEYSRMRKNIVNEEIQKVKDVLCKVDSERLRINIKLTAGRSGYEIAKFVRKVEADLLVMSAPQRSFSFFHKVFPHDLEYLLADLPCNLLIVNKY